MHCHSTMNQCIYYCTSIKWFNYVPIIPQYMHWFIYRYILYIYIFYMLQRPRQEDNDENVSGCLSSQIFVGVQGIVYSNVCCHFFCPLKRVQKRKILILFISIRTLYLFVKINIYKCFYTYKVLMFRYKFNLI